MNRPSAPYGNTTLLLLPILLLAACGRQGPSTQDQLEELTVGITPFMGEMATYVAQEQGLFERHGLRVILRENGAGPVSVAQLLQGEVDIAHMSETPFLMALLDSAHARNGALPPMRVIADMIVARQIQKVVARRSSGIEGPRDLLGKRVALPMGTQAEYYLDALLLEHQLPTHGLRTVHTPPDALASTVLSGEADAIVIWEPYATAIIGQLGEDAVVLPTRLTISTLWLAVTMEGTLRERPQALTAYLLALRDAQEHMQRHPEATKALMARRTGTSIDVLERLWPDLDHELSLSERMLTLMEDHLRWLAEKRGTGRALDLTGFVSTDPMDGCCPHRVSMVR